MDWNATWLNMANTALTRINKQVLQTLDDSSTSAMLCNQLIPQCVKMVLNQNDWHSARKRALIAPQLESPAFGYDHQFAMPSDFVRLVKVESELPWEKEGEMILSDEEALAIIYIAYPNTPDTLDPLIVDTITTLLAAQLSVSLTSDSTITNLLYQETEQKLYKAKLAEDAGEPDEKPDLHDWSTALGGVFGA